MRPSIVYSGFCASDANGWRLSIGRTAVEEEVRIVAEGEQAEAARIVDVLVDDARHAGRVERVAEQPHVLRAAAERQKLHEEPPVEPLRLSVLHAALFREVGRLRTASGRGLVQSSGGP